jgi:phage terminase large subunit-like protein
MDAVTQYAIDVVTGVEVAGPHVRNACKRHLDDLRLGAERGLHFDPERAERIFRFFETRLRLSGGEFSGQNIQLHPSQKFILGSLEGWRMGEYRRFQRAYIEQGKGNGKSPLIAGLGMFGLVADGEGSPEIYAAASSKDQANVMFRDAVAMYLQSPWLQKRLVPTGGVNPYNLMYAKNMGFFKPISPEGAYSGPRPHMALIDELHEHRNGTVIEMLERGFKFRKQPLIVMITNSGVDRSSVCWAERTRAIQVAAGTKFPDPETYEYVGEPLGDREFSYVCALDPGDDWQTDERCWRKVNPLLGVTIQPEYLRGVVKQAIDMPSKASKIMRLHFCIWTDSENAWIGQTTLRRALSDSLFDPFYLRSNEKLFLGVDLAATLDFTAVAGVVHTGFKTVLHQNPDGTTIELLRPTFRIWVRNFTPADTLATRAERDQADYLDWAKTENPSIPPAVITSPGEVLRVEVPAGFVGNVNAKAPATALAYDRYAFSDFQNALEDVGASIPCYEHPQGARRKNVIIPAETKPDGSKTEEVSLWMPKSLRQFEEAVYEGRVELENNPALISAILSAVALSDPNDNRYLSKNKSTQRIDAAVAVVMAFGLANLRLAPPAATESYVMQAGGVYIV